MTAYDFKNQKHLRCTLFPLSNVSVRGQRYQVDGASKQNEVTLMYIVIATSASLAACPSPEPAHTRLATKHSLEFAT